MKSRNHVILILAFAVMACNHLHADENTDPEATFVPVSAISKRGFAISRKRMKALHGRKIKVVGFVDHSNILKDSRDGRGIHSKEWRFNLKGSPDAEAGESFAVRVTKDAGRDKILKVIGKNELDGKPTKIYVEGKLFTFDAPTNIVRLTGLYMEVRSSDDISFKNPDAIKRGDLRTKR